MNEQFESQMEPLVELFLEALETGNTQRPSTEHLGEKDQQAAEHIFNMLEATWGSDGHIKPATGVEEQDGSVDESTTLVLLDSNAIRKARTALNLKPSDVGRILESSPARLTSQEVARLELQQAKAIPLGQARALASALKLTLPELVHSAKGGLVEYVFGPRFNEQVTTWATDNDRNVSDARKMAQTRMLAARLRSSGDACEADWDRVLDAVLESMS